MREPISAGADSGQMAQVKMEFNDKRAIRIPIA